MSSESRDLDLAVLAVEARTARCRVVGGDEIVSVRARDLVAYAPGEIVTVRPTRSRQAGERIVTGDIVGRRIDVAALDLVPLALQDCGMWDPAQEYWGEEDEPLEDWAREIVDDGPRPAFEMEQVVPGAQYDDPEGDPIFRAVELKAAGNGNAARAILMALLELELRCLDAHAHLGNLVFSRAPERALRHYEVGLKIGELSLGAGFDGVLAWGFLDNRPFLRCMHGYALCLWRLTRQEEALKVFERMLRFNPTDNTGVRFLLPHIRAGLNWRADY